MPADPAGAVPGPTPPDRDRPDDLIVLAIRVGVVASLGVLAVQTDVSRRAPLGVVLALVAVAALYALLLAAARVVGRTGPRPVIVSGTDAVLSLLAVGLTGGASSLAVAVLPLVVIANSLRTERRRSETFALLVGAAYTAACVLGSTPAVPPVDRVVTGLWWTFYLAAVAALAGVFVRRLDRQYRAVARAQAETIAERDALVEERDLRRRLLESHQARLDGLRVIVHEFRAPTVSLGALARAAAQDAPSPTLDLIRANVEHLEEMLDGVSDVARIDGPALGPARNRMIRPHDLAVAALTAAGLPPERQAIVVRPSALTVHGDPQRLRRLIGNLAENAARHSGPAVVELEFDRQGKDLVVEVRDRGPGLSEDQLGLVTQKYVSMGDRRGTSGLGLWIVSELTATMGGKLTLSARDGGGLVARLVLPAW